MKYAKEQLFKQTERRTFIWDHLLQQGQQANVGMLKIDIWHLSVFQFKTKYVIGMFS